VLSDSTERHDRGVEFRDFEAHGVGDYWIIDPEQEVLEQYLPRAGDYRLALKSGSGEVESGVICRFRISIRAIFDDAENLRVLREMLS
jgi:Uma2 family endonuclease